MPEKLYLTGYKKQKWANTVRAVRDVRGAVYGEARPSIDEANDIVSELRDTREPVLVAEHDDLEVLQSAAATHLAKVEALWDFNLITEQAEHVIPEGEDGDFVVPFRPGEREPLVVSEEGVRATIVTMAFAQGNPSAAMTMANTYFQATEEPTWEEVRDLLRTTFPRPSK